MSLADEQLPAGEDRRRWLAMPFIALGVAMIIVDATIVNVAVPTIIRDLHMTAVTAEWINSIYSLVFAALLITLGRIGDMVGRRRLFRVGTVWFVLASLVAATAQSSAILILGRFLQGIGGAMILPATLSTVNSLFRGRERAIAFAVWGSTIGGMAAIGPFLGGVLTTDLSWRWAFLINVPIGAAIIAGLLTVVPETSDPQTPRGVDVPGQVTLIVGLTMLVFGLIEGQTYGWWTATRRLALLSWPQGAVSPVPVAFAVALLSLTAFVLIERRRRRHRRIVVVDLRLFSIASFSRGNAAALIVSLGEFGLLFVLPLYLQGALGLSALDTGAALIPLAGGTLLAGGMTPQLAPRLGPRGVVQLGLVLEVVGIGTLGLVLTDHSSVWALIPWLFVYGVGVGFATAQLTGVILTEVPVAASGQGSGIQSTFRQVGSALGIALLGTILITTLGSGVTHRLRSVPGLPPAARTTIAGAVRASGGSAIVGLRARPGSERIVAAASGALTASARAVAFTAAAFVAVGLLFTAGLPNPRGQPAEPEGAGA
ncbi:MAG TPA: MFS transporter [Solirubrobacteraceae bacterium]|nr:MFS transporter [Solirubrobacteraceae bacterium]